VREQRETLTMRILRKWRTGEYKNSPPLKRKWLAVKTALTEDEIRNFILNEFTKEEISLLERFVLIEENLIKISPSLLYVNFSLYEKLYDLFSPYKAKQKRELS